MKAIHCDLGGILVGYRVIPWDILGYRVIPWDIRIYCPSCGQEVLAEETRNG